MVLSFLVPKQAERPVFFGNKQHNKPLSSAQLSESPPSSEYSFESATGGTFVDAVDSRAFLCKTKTQRHLTPAVHASEPDTDYYSSNHVLVNQARQLRGMPKLRRCRELDELARQHAVGVAAAQTISHSVGNLPLLQQRLGSLSVGENVQRGTSIKAMHAATMNMPRSSINRFNLLNDQFTEMGMATARGGDGNLYMVQLFRGDPTEAEKETV